MLTKKLTGLAVCGGKSTRMGTDKSKIVYHGEQHRYYVYKMLQQFCDEVFISCNEEQAMYINEEYQFIVDDAEYADIGPAAALLSAEKKFPEKNWLVVACDYPFITTADLEHFISTLKDKTVAAAFYSPAKKVYEPLLAYYPAQDMSQMITILKGENYSLQHYLRIINADKHVADKDVIRNINTADEMRAAKALIKLRKDEIEK